MDEPSMDEPAGPLGPRAHLRHAASSERAVATLALAALTLFVVATNLLWVQSHRAGLPFNVDEAGYLQRAIRDGDALSVGGLSGFWDAFRVRDPQAPLLPMSAGVLHWATGVGPTGLIASEQVFVAIAVISTFLIARRLQGRALPALVAAAGTAALPGVIDGGRGFAFAVPAAALMAATLAAQLAAEDFRRLHPALIWGVLFGLSTLTRTVMLALLPALIVALVLRLLVSRAGVRQWVHAAAGVLLSLAVAATWYSATWRPVWSYLTDFGYGQQAEVYGSGRSVLSTDWWTYRLTRAANTLVYLPLSLAAIVCLVAAVRRPLMGSKEWIHELGSVGMRFLRSNWGTVTVVLLVAYLVLSSSQNRGSSFELPLLPLATALVVSAAAVSGRTSRAIALWVTVAAVSFSLVANDGLLPGNAQRKIFRDGSTYVVAYDSLGPIRSYAQTYLEGEPAGDSEPVLRRWERADHLLADTLLAEGIERGTPAPVVFFGMQDAFVNTNTLALRAQQRRITLPIGLLVPAKVAGESMAMQLVDPRRGIPNVLILGQPPSGPASAEFSPLQARDMPAARAAARSVGFEKTSSITLPDGRKMDLWWRKAQ